MTPKKPKDYYKILGVAHTASDSEIKSAYRSLARKYHPDVNQGNVESEKKFKEISEAYSVLSDDKQRYLIDLALGFKTIDKPKRRTQRKAQSATNPSASSSGKTATKSTKSSTDSKKDKQKDSGIADAFTNLFDNIIKNADMNTKTKKGPSFTTDPPPAQKEKATYTDVGRNARRRSRSLRGDDITLDIYLSASEAISGTIRTVNILHTDPCRKCKATGILAGSQCQYCNGKGETTEYKKLDVKIPAGIKNGSKLRIAKEGNKGLNENERGDLYLNIKLYNPSNFEFDGANVFSEVSIAPHEAVLGTEMQVLTVDGFVKMKIPPATQAAQKFRLVGQGLPDKSGGRGNHFVKINIEIPENISDREKELYEEIARISKFNPREYVE